MTPRNPVEFTDIQHKRVGNQVVLSDANGNPVYNGITFADTPNIDSFGRLRTSEPANRFDFDSVLNIPLDLLDVVTTNGSVTHNANPRDITLSLSDANNGSQAALYSYDVPYTAGNSQLIDITGVLNFAGLSGTAQIFLRSSTSGSVAETVIDQANWDNPVPDVKWNKSQILVMSFQSLRVGSIDFAMSRKKQLIPIHRLNNDNVRGTGYWQTPNLPLYWRIYNDTTYTYMEMGYGDTTNAIGFRYRIAANANATMKAICGTVKSEGGMGLFDIPGFERAIDNGVTAKTVSTTLIPVLSIRPSATFNSLANRGLYIPTGYTVQGSNPIRYVLLYRPTLTNPSWTAVNATYSGMEYDVTASAVSGGIVVDSDYLSTTAVNRATKDEGLLGRTLLKLGRTGTSDILTVAAIRSSTNDSATLAALKWKELR